MTWQPLLNIPNKVYENHTIAHQCKEDFEKRGRVLHVRLLLKIKPWLKWTSHGKLQYSYRESSVFVRVNDVCSSTLSERNTWAFCNLADLTFHTGRTGLISRLWPKVVLYIHCAVVEMLNCWVIECMIDGQLKWKMRWLMSKRLSTRLFDGSCWWEHGYTTRWYTNCS